ncbi:alpha-amylase family glycosyl hydrolase [Thermogemmatispora sp.]|uniref:alpha-amylase family glycosyl hydrolase n=1 Tax=Thermogemmatispora sp. TaxID=1968838 RepID=UPI0035E4433A
MSEVFEPFATEAISPPDPAAVAAVPGDLPLTEVLMRQAAQRSQFRHDNTIRPLEPHPGEPVEVWATSGEELPIERAVLFYTVDGSRPDLSATELPMQRTCVTWDPHAGYVTHWLATIPGQPAGTLVRYRIAGWLLTQAGPTAAAEPQIWAQDGQGFAFHFAGERAFTTFAYQVEEEEQRQPPAWTKEAIIYHIFLDRFRSDAADGNFLPGSEPQALHGGTLNGVRAALPYLAELGVSCLWLSPLHLAESYHRYDALDYCAVDPRLGSAADLKALVDEAHGRGMRVLLDFVPAHVSWHHPAFLAAQSDHQAPSRDWFYFERWPDRYGTFLDAVPGLPSLRSESEGARQYIIASALHWLREYGVDGFRLDHAIGLGFDFWCAFRRATRSLRSDIFTVGEVTDTPDAMRRYRGRLDAVLDFPLAAALRYTFGARTWDLRRFESFLSSYERYMTTGPARVSFLDNHDMNRFLFVAGDRPELLKLAALCQFTLAPVPVIYYGTEIGMSQRADVSATGFGGDAEARGDMSWRRQDWNHELLAFYQALTRLRRTLPVLAAGERRVVHLAPEQATYAYLRTFGCGQRLQAGDALVLFNRSEQVQTLMLPEGLLPPPATCLLTTTSRPVIRRSQHQVAIMIEPLSGAVFSLPERG